jgi:Tol biopolymer transport system component
MKLLLILACVTTLDAQEKPKPAMYHNPTWSPDSRTIAFESTRDGGYAVFTVGFDGSNLRKLTRDDVDGGQPSWSPDGKHIVFSATRDKRGNIYVMNADGAGETQLTDFPPGGGKYGAHFSPDGRWIVFQGRSSNVLVNENIYIVRSDGRDMHRLTDTTLNSLSPSWTNDGNIQFSQNRYSVLLWDQMKPEIMRAGNAQTQLVTMRPDGVEVSRVSKPGSGESSTDDETSPDGRFIVSAKNNGDTWGIYVKDVATGVERVVAGGNPQAARVKP